MTHLGTQQFADDFGFRVNAPHTLVEDPSGDELDALLCATQAAWAWAKRNQNFGLPADSDPLEGWIAHPQTSLTRSKPTGHKQSTLRKTLIATALEWQERFGVGPAITSAISEYDAAMLVGLSEEEYASAMQNQTAVQKGHDFEHQGVRYQVKGNRPSGKPGSKVTMVPKAKNFLWDKLIWVLYDKEYRVLEAWCWDVEDYKAKFETLDRLSPNHMREGTRLQ